MRFNVWKVSTVVLAGALAAVVGGNFIGEATAEEKQPHMKAALKLLKEADEQLEKATADKGGHRVKAREHVKNAVDEVKKGIEFDSKN
ncbi:MAG: hypothetical protein IPK82_33895 [Polyangiaceae bacterium]|nr:hypothetical protein [Polyangiaceae bacterium]